MSKRLPICILVLLIIGFQTIIAQNSTDTTKVENTKKGKSLGTLTIGGYGEAVYKYNFFSDNVFRYSHAANYAGSKGHGRVDLPHAVIMLGYDFGHGWSFNTEIEFEHGGTESAVEVEAEETGEFEKEIERGGEVALEQFWLQKSWGKGLNLRMGHIIVPVGVSFFTFKLISYLIEIHREHIEPCRDMVEFATYIAFFPTLLSGPIDRPNTFIPQLRKSHSLDYAQAVDGCRQILWGMFTKICIADHLALVTDYVWADYSHQAGSTLLIWSLLYTMQIYTDFDGYSNMAIGVGKILGFNITRNFNHPLLARNIAEFWRNWHISLTSWITDYVFMPLNIAFRNMANWGVMLAVTINIVLIGLWHGSNWTFGLFGLYHAMLYVPLVLSGAFGKNKKLRPNDHGLPKLKDFSKMVLNYVLVSLGFIVFYASSVADAFRFFSGIVSTSLFSMPSLPVKKATMLFMLIVLILEWVTRKKEHPLQFSTDGIFRYTAVRYLLYAGIGILLFVFAGEVETFIYFQF